MEKSKTSSTVDILTPVDDSAYSSQASIPQQTKKPIKKPNFLSQYSQNARNGIENFRVKNEKGINTFINVIVHICFVIYFAFATKHFVDRGLDYIPFCDDDEYGLLILLVSFIYLIVLYSYVIKPFVIPAIAKGLKLDKKNSCLSSPYVKWSVYIILLAAILGFLIIDSLNDPNRLIALVGFFCMLLFGFVFSEHPGDIKWRPVILGLIVQFALGLLTIRWEHGRNIFKCTGDKVSTFLQYTDVGSSFVYGNDLIKNNVFAFQALSVIFFLSFFVKILYYYGVIQKVVLSLGWVLQQIMGTTICESVNSAANIFLGMTEAPILLQPYLMNLTNSELFAVMTAGFASVSGTVLAAYISFGAKPAHLITASVMSAPAALCFSKLYYPETEESMSTEDTIEIPESDDSGVLDAASKGASQAVDIVLGISANVIAFVTFVAFLNGVIGWLGVLVGYDSWSVEEGLAYVFMPLSYVMGVPWDECKYVGKLIGIKTAINEFSAYKELGVMVNQNLLKPRTEMIATYAICGFSNPGSVGIMISTLSTLIPGKREAITSMIFKSFTAGAIVCFMTACIAGMLISPDQLH